MSDARKLKIKLVKSLIGRPGKHRKIVNALGLYKTNDEVEQYETKTIMGMLYKIPHLVQVEAG